MLLTFFRQDRPQAYAVLVLILAALLFPGVTQAPEPDAAHAMPLARPLLPLLSGPSLSAKLLMFALVLVNALLLDHMANQHELLGRRSHLPALMFTLTLPLGPTGTAPSMALLGTPFVLMALHRVLATAGRSRVLGVLFDAGLLVGLAGVVHLPLLFMVVMIWTSVSVMRPFQWREYVVPLLAALLPLLLLVAAGELGVIGPVRPFATLRHAQPEGPWEEPVRRTLIVLLFLFLLLAGVLSFVANYRSSVVRAKDLRSAFLSFVLCLMVPMGLERLLNGAVPSVFLAVPGAMVFSYPLVGRRRTWLGETALLSLLALALWAQWAR
jgi:hypothetical protein